MSFFGPEPAFERLGNLRHELVIGPLCDHPSLKRKARLYYCIGCKWSLLVCGSKIVMLDENRKPADAEGIDRSDTTEAGPCPVLDAFASQL